MSQDPAPYLSIPEDDATEVPERWERTYAEIADLLGAELRRAGHDGAHEGLAARLACRLCESMGGRQYYIPTGAPLERARRDREIAAAHDGTRTGSNGVQALAARYRLSEIHIYRILDRQRELRRGQVQGDLFGRDE